MGGDGAHLGGHDRLNAIADLTEATGVERTALYSAFGNKEALFRRALTRYHERYLGYLPEALTLPTSRQVAAHFLRGAVDLDTRYPDRTGCFGINGVLAGSSCAMSACFSRKPKLRRVPAFSPPLFAACRRSF